MAMRVAIRDETSSGEVLHEGYLKLLTAKTTAREIIRERILQEVGDVNRQRGRRPSQCLVQPTSTETLLNAPPSPRKRPDVDWRKQFEIACEAFERNGFLVLVDDRQVENLDDEISIQAETTVSFLKLVPLVGG